MNASVHDHREENTLQVGIHQTKEGYAGGLDILFWGGPKDQDVTPRADFQSEISQQVFVTALGY
jgi:hypothetical protein